MSIAQPQERVRPGPSRPQPSESISAQIARNAAWLFCSEGLTKSLFFVANVVLARFLSAADYGVLTLAQSWILFAWIVADMGIMMYGQAEAARCAAGPDTTALSWEILPLRALLGALLFIALQVLVPFFTTAPTLRITIAAAALYLLGQAISAEWLFRGKERFDVVLIGNAAGAAVFLAAVVAIGSGAGAVIKDALAWSLSAFAMAAVYLIFLPRLIGVPRNLGVSTNAWRRHLGESSFFALSNIISESYRVLPFLLLGMLASRREVGLFAAPMRLVVNMASLGFLIPMAFYPASARLFRERPEVFAESRRGLVLTMLAIGAPAAVVGTRMAAPIITLIFGEGYRDSARIFALLVWKLPLYFVRYIYGTTVLATGFQRLHSVASAAAAAVGLLVGIPLVRHFGGSGAASTLICSEVAMTAAMIAISAHVHHDAAIPPPAKLIRLAIVLVAMWVCGALFDSVLGALSSVLLMLTIYIIGLSALGVVDWRRVAGWFLAGGVLDIRASQSH